MKTGKKILSLLLLGLALGSSFSHADIIDQLFGAGAFGRDASPAADRRNCIERLIKNTMFMRDKSWKNRVVLERDPDFFDDRAYLNELNYSRNRLGVVDSRYVPEFDTRIYYTATAKADADGHVPMVDPEAPVLFVYFHGSGTRAASGVTGSVKMNKLADMGFAGLSFDLPYHQDGSPNPKLMDTQKFADYVKSIVETYRQPGQKVVLWGHSFGPDVVFEVGTRYPHLADALVGISPGGFDKVTKDWFENKTARMVKIFGDVDPNDKGGFWAAAVTGGNTWNNLKSRSRAGLEDPTIANPDLKVVVVSGDREEYIPGPLDADGLPTKEPRTYNLKPVFQNFFHNADVHTEPGVGHYIFAHQDADGNDVILKTLLKASGNDIAQTKELRAEYNRRRPDQLQSLGTKYYKDPFFRKWVDYQYGDQTPFSGLKTLTDLIQANDKKSGTRVLNEFQAVEKMRTDALYDNIRATQQWAPRFYARNAALIAEIGEKGFNSDKLNANYVEFLDSLTDYERKVHGLVDRNLFAKAADEFGRNRKVAAADVVKSSGGSLINGIGELAEKARSENPEERKEAVRNLSAAFMSLFGKTLHPAMDLVVREIIAEHGGSQSEVIKDLKSSDPEKVREAQRSITTMAFAAIRNDVDGTNKLNLSEEQKSFLAATGAGLLPEEAPYKNNEDLDAELRKNVMRIFNKIGDKVQKEEAH